MSSALENECVNKSPCRHALHAIQPARVRRALRRLAAFKCQQCQEQMHRRKSGTHRKRKEDSSECNETSSHHRSHSEKPLSVCLYCGFITCRSDAHYRSHQRMHPKHMLMLDTWTGKLFCFVCNDLDATKESSGEGELRCKVEKLRLECLDIVRQSKAFVSEMKASEFIAAKNTNLVASVQQQTRSNHENKKETSRSIGSEGRVHSTSNSSTCSSNPSVQSDLSSPGCKGPPVQQDSFLNQEESDRCKLPGMIQAEEPMSWVRNTRGDYGTVEDDQISTDPVVKDLAKWTLIEPPHLSDSTQGSGQASEESDSSKENLCRVPEHKQIKLHLNDSATDGAYSYENETKGNLKGVFGFTNLGNTCYFNATMQAILTVIHYEPESPSFKQFVDKKNYGTAPLSCIFAKLCDTIRTKQVEKQKSYSKYVNAPDSQEKLVKTKLRKQATKKHTLVQDQKTKKSSRKAHAPYLILSVSPILKTMRSKFAQFRGHAQQDAHELLISFLWAIDDEYRDTERSSMSETSNPTDSESGLDDQEEDAELKGQPESPVSRPGLNQIFVKVDDGTTYSFQLPLNTSIGELQSIVARKLKLSGDNFYLQINRQRSSVEQDTSPNTTPRMQIDLGELPKKKESFIQALFGCEMMTVIVCKNCAHSSRTSEACFQLSLPIPGHSKHREEARSVTLFDCLSALIAPTELSTGCGNGYQCDKCSTLSISSSFSPKTTDLRDATMQTLISRAPRILILHLKRLNRTRKINEHIKFSAEMDFGTWFRAEEQENCTTRNSNRRLTYELISVIVHSGNRGSGHYACFVSRNDDQSSGRHWFYTSDANVRRVSIEEVLGCQAYILFYRQTSKVEVNV